MELALILLSSSSFFAVIRMSVSWMVQLPFRYSRLCKDDVAAAETTWWGLRGVVAAVGGGSDMALASLRKKCACVPNEVISRENRCLENGFTIASFFFLFSFFFFKEKNNKT